MNEYIKTFGKGQVTIPKKLRDACGVDNKTWLRVFANGRQIVMEPVNHVSDAQKNERLKELLSMDGSWVDEDDYRKIREEMEDKIKRLHGE
jgi:hypothetical protein